LLDQDGCPETFTSGIKYEANDKVSIPINDTKSLVYLCNSDVHASRYCEQFEPGNEYELGWVLVARCDGTLAPTTAPNFEHLQEVSGCPREYSASATYKQGDQVAAFLLDDNRAVVFACKPWPESAFCNAGSSYAPGSMNANMGWIMKGYCDSTLSPTASPVLYPENKCRWYNGTKPVIIKSWSKEDLSSYKAGTRVRLGHQIFKCLGWPRDLWCKIAAYGPSGDYWANAWMKAGSCSDPYSPTVSPSLSPTSSPTNPPSTAPPTTAPVSRISMESTLEWNVTCSLFQDNATALVEVAKAIEESVYTSMDPKLDADKVIEYV
jgi:hypothetical protein